MYLPTLTSCAIYTTVCFI